MKKIGFMYSPLWSLERSQQLNNRPTYRYTFLFNVRPTTFDPDELKKLYLDEHLSTKQIADKLDVSKSLVIKWLHRLGIRNQPNRLTHKDNYRHWTPPFGWKLRQGNLALNRAELMICRQVVHLIRQGLSYSEVAKELSRRKYKNRRGNTSWHHQTISNIFKRWKEKL